MRPFDFEVSLLVYDRYLTPQVQEQHYLNQEGGEVSMHLIAWEG